MFDRCSIALFSEGSIKFSVKRFIYWADAVLVRKRVPDVPDSMPAAQTIRRCFAFEPSKRPTAAELAEALNPEAAALPEVVADVTRELQRVTEELQCETGLNQVLQQRLQTEQEAAQAREHAAQLRFAEQEQQLHALQEEVHACWAINAQMYRRVDELETELESLVCRRVELEDACARTQTEVRMGCGQVYRMWVCGEQRCREWV